MESSRTSANLDIAVEAGAKFIVVVNLLVPYVNDFQKQIPTLTGSRTRRVSTWGFPQIGYQAFKLLAYQRLHEIARAGGRTATLGRHHPHRARAQRRTDVPDQRHELHLAGRHRAPWIPVGDAQAGQRLSPVQADLRPARDRVSGTRVQQVVKHFETEREKTRAWRKILEQTTSTLLRQSAQE